MSFDFEFKNELSVDDDKQLLDFLHIISNEFIPPLSSRFSDRMSDFKNIKGGSVEQYYNSLLDGYFLLAYDKGKLVGFLAYKPFYFVESLNDAYIYISCIGVLNDYRGCGLANLLYSRLLACIGKGRICVRTWSTNIAHIRVLNSLDFKVEKVISNDRDIGIDTYYFTKII